MERQENRELSVAGINSSSSIIGRTLLFIVSLFLIVICVAASLADLLALADPLEQNARYRLQPPSWDNYFGTDGLGRDVFSRVIYASRTSLYIAFLSILIAGSLGVLIGTISGYLGGSLDIIVQRFVDVVLAFPMLVLVLIICIALGTSATSIALAISIAQTPHIIRLSRACTVQVTNEPYLEAATVLGGNPLWIMKSHVLPNTLPIVLPQIAGYFGIALVAEASMSFLGLGVQAPYPSWGGMIEDGALNYFEIAPWTTIFPGLALGLTTLSLVIIGDSVTDMIDSSHHIVAN